MAEGTDYECPHPFLGAWGTPTPYVGPPCVPGTWSGEDWSALSPVLSSMTSERIQGSEKGGEASSDPHGHLWVTFVVYLWAGQPPWADIILSHPADLT